MPGQSYYALGEVYGSALGVQPTHEGQDILIRESDIGHSLACLLGFGNARIILKGDERYWLVAHNREVDELLVELINLMISIRYAHPTLVQLELVLEPNEA